MSKSYDTSLLILAILGISGGAIGTLTMPTFGLAPMANRSPEDIHLLWRSWAGCHRRRLSAGRRRGLGIQQVLQSFV